MTELLTDALAALTNAAGSNRLHIAMANGATRPSGSAPAAQASRWYWLERANANLANVWWDEFDVRRKDGRTVKALVLFNGVEVLHTVRWW